MNLHDITTEPHAWVWFSVTGGNGQPIRGNMRHAYHITRGEPKAYPIGNPMRQWWRPWQTTPQGRTAILTPACGPLATTATQLRVIEHYWRFQADCPNCHTLVQPQDVTTLQNADPWTEIWRPERTRTIDPVSGL
jgi:hypothetical protein